MSSSADAISIRTLHSSEEMEAAVDLQTVYWGPDMGALVPSHMLMSLARYGGNILGAFDGDRMVGILIGFLGAALGEDETGRLYPAAQRLLVMSKRMVVLPEYRGQKIGERLKWEQRNFALRHGIPLVTWTFDPMLSRNAYLNLRKLGGVIQHYEKDYFGGAAYTMLSEDRVVLNWWVRHPRCEAARTRSADEYRASGAAFLAARTAGGVGRPPEAWDLPRTDVVLFEVPRELTALARIDPSLGRAWRDYTRAVFQRLLAAGYIVTDFVQMRPGETGDHGHSYYVFETDPGEFGYD